MNKKLLNAVEKNASGFDSGMSFGDQMSEPVEAQEIKDPDFIEYSVGKYAKIPLKFVRVRKNVREDFNEDRLKELTDSIKDQGQRQPIEVINRGTYYEIYTGERRYRACNALGFETINCIVVSPFSDEINRIFGQAIENLQRENLSPQEEEKCVSELLSLGVLREDICARMHKEMSWLSRVLAAAKIREKASEALSELPEVPTSRAVSELAGLSNEEVSKAVKMVVAEGGTGTQAQLKKAKNAIKPTARAAKKTEKAEPSAPVNTEPEPEVSEPSIASGLDIEMTGEIEVVHNEVKVAFDIDSTDKTVAFSVSGEVSNYAFNTALIDFIKSYWKKEGFKADDEN